MPKKCTRYKFVSFMLVVDMQVSPPFLREWLMSSLMGVDSSL